MARLEAGYLPIGVIQAPKVSIRMNYIIRAYRKVLMSNLAERGRSIDSGEMRCHDQG